MITIALGALSLLVGLLGILLVILGGAFKYVHSRLLKDMENMQEDMKDDKEMLNGRINTVKNDLKNYVEKTDARLNSIDGNIVKILTILEKD